MFTFSNPSGTGVGNFTISGASTGSATTNNVVQTSTSGSGTSAEFTVTASSGDYTVTVTDVGSGYAVGDTILIEGQNIGGTQGTHDLTLTITHLQGASVGTATHTGETQTATSGSGSGCATCSSDQRLLAQNGQCSSCHERYAGVMCDTCDVEYSGYPNCDSCSAGFHNTTSILAGGECLSLIHI